MLLTRISELEPSAVKIAYEGKCNDMNREIHVLKAENGNLKKRLEMVEDDKAYLSKELSSQQELNAKLSEKVERLVTEIQQRNDAHSKHATLHSLCPTCDRSSQLESNLETLKATTEFTLLNMNKDLTDLKQNTNKLVMESKNILEDEVRELRDRNRRLELAYESVMVE